MFFGLRIFCHMVKRPHPGPYIILSSPHCSCGNIKVIILLRIMVSIGPAHRRFGTLKDRYIHNVPLPRGCVPVHTVLKDGYVRKVPLPQTPRIQHASHVTNVTQDTCYLVQVPRIPMWSDLTAHRITSRFR